MKRCSGISRTARNYLNTKTILRHPLPQTPPLFSQWRWTAMPIPSRIQVGICATSLCAPVLRDTGYMDCLVKNNLLIWTKPSRNFNSTKVPSGQLFGLCAGRMPRGLTMKTRMRGGDFCWPSRRILPRQCRFLWKTFVGTGPSTTRDIIRIYMSWCGPPIRPKAIWRKRV